MEKKQPGTHLETYSNEWRHFFKVDAPVALLVIAINAVMGFELSWPALGLIWALIVILPLAWKLPPAPSIESDQ